MSKVDLWLTRSAALASVFGPLWLLGGWLMRHSENLGSWGSIGVCLAAIGVGVFFVSKRRRTKARWISQVPSDLPYPTPASEELLVIVIQIRTLAKK